MEASSIEYIAYQTLDLIESKVEVGELSSATSLELLQYNRTSLKTLVRKKCLQILTSLTTYVIGGGLNLFGL